MAYLGAGEVSKQLDLINTTNLGLGISQNHSKQRFKTIPGHFKISFKNSRDVLRRVSHHVNNYQIQSGANNLT